MSFAFEYHGGSVIFGGKIIKFLCLVAPFPSEKELFLSNAVKAGYVTQKTTNVYETEYPIIKIFSSQSGFGERYLFQSYFFKLGEAGSSYKYRILPFTTNSQNYYFSAAGRFMEEPEIKSAFCTETVHYYLRQPVLSSIELSRCVKKIPLNSAGVEVTALNVRRIL